MRGDFDSRGGLAIGNWKDRKAFVRCGLLIWAVVTAAALFPGNCKANPSAQARDIPNVLAVRGKNLTALKAVMAISTTNEKDNARQDVRGFLLYRRPGDFRFQGVGPGGNSLFEMVVKSNKFELYVPADGKVLKGGRSCFFERFPDVAELESLIPLALLQWKNAAVTNVVADEPARTVLALKFNGNSWRATLEPKTLLLTRLEKMGSKSVEITSDFAEFTEGEYGWLPRRFDIRSPAGGWRTQVRINKIEINPFLVEKNFELETAFSPKIEQCP